MKKIIAGILAFICVLAPLNGSWATSSGNKSTSIIMEAAAEDAELPTPGKNAAKYSYKYADTNMYTTKVTPINILDENNKTYTWQSSDKMFTYGIYQVIVTPVGEKDAVVSEYVVGISKANENVIDIDLSVAAEENATVKAFLEKKEISLANLNIRYLAPRSFANSYLKTINLGTVEYIGDSAFDSCKYITDIELPKTVKYVGSSVFNSSGLKTLSVQNDMPVVPIGMCMGTPLTKITFAHPEFIHTVDKNAFKNSSVPGPVFMTSYGTDISGYELIDINEGAYEGCTQIKSVEMTDNVTSLGIGSFRNCTSITSLKCGKNFLGMDRESFKGCTSLKDITFNDIIIGIGGGCFQGCTSLVTVSGIPETIGDWVYTNVTKGLGYGFADGVFSNCTKLVSCTLPVGLTKIPKNTFNGCTAFTTLAFNGSTDTKNIVTIGEFAFNNCTSLVTADFPNATCIGADLDDPKTSYFDASDKEKMVGGGSAFAGCTKLQKVNIPASEYIYQNSFKNCTALTEFKAGKCKKVGNNVMDGCTAIKEITLLSDQYGNAAPTKSNTTDGFTFQNCSSATKITIDAKFLVNFPNKTPNGFFNGCTKLTDIVTENGDFSKVTVVSTKTFSGCKALKEMAFKDIRIVEDSAFADCTSLTKISADANTPLNAEDYGASAFLNCENLKFTISGNFSTIGNSAFKGSGVTAVNIEGMQGGTVVIGNNAFDSCPNLIEATILSDNAAKFSIGTSVFANCPNLKKATYEGQFVPANMFLNCTALTSVITNAKNIKASAFSGDSALEMVADKADPTKTIIADEINDYAFRDCKSLKVLPANIDTVLKGNSIFENCEALTKAEVGMLTQSIFSGCTGLSDVKLGENINDIPRSAFAKCTSLGTIDIENMDTIGASAFEYSGLKSVKLKDAQSIDSNAFANCAALADIDVTAGKINSRAFYNCTELAKAAITANTIESSAFENCSALSDVALKSDDSHSLTSIGTTAFNNCKSLNTLTVSGSPTMGNRCVGFVNGKVNPDFVLLGDKGSTVEAYATTNKITFRDASNFDPSSLIVPGDANCDNQVDMSDIVLVMQALASPNKYGTSGTDKNHITSRGTENADVFERGSGMTNADALEIQKYLLKIVDKLS